MDLKDRRALSQYTDCTVLYCTDFTVLNVQLQTLVAFWHAHHGTLLQMVTQNTRRKCEGTVFNQV